MMGIKIILTFKILYLDSKLSFSVKDIKECWNYFMINKRLKKNKYKKNNEFWCIFRIHQKSTSETRISCGCSKNSKNYMRYQFAALIFLASKRYTVFYTCYLQKAIASKSNEKRNENLDHQMHFY